MKKIKRKKPNIVAIEECFREFIRSNPTVDHNEYCKLSDFMEDTLVIFEDYQRQTEAIKLFMSAFPELAEEVAKSK